MFSLLCLLNSNTTNRMIDDFFLVEGSTTNDHFNTFSFGWWEHHCREEKRSNSRKRRITEWNEKTKWTRKTKRVNNFLWILNRVMMKDFFFSCNWGSDIWSLILSHFYWILVCCYDRIQRRFWEATRNEHSPNPCKVFKIERITLFRIDHGYTVINLTTLLDCLFFYHSKPTRKQIIVL